MSLPVEHLNREELLVLVEQLKGQVRDSLNQRSETIEKTYEAVHNGPLQDLAVLLREDADGGLGEPLRSQLEKISQDLRGIYQSMRLAAQNEVLYLESGLTLNVDLPLTHLLHHVFEHTLARDFPGYAGLKFQITPDFTPLADAEQVSRLTAELKRGICLFFQEALCNVGKHSVGTTKLMASCEKKNGHYYLRVTDNGETPSVVESLLQSLTEGPETDPKKHQGTRQAKALAQQLNGKFQRRQNEPQGTICELYWSCTGDRDARKSEDNELENFDDN